MTEISRRLHRLADHLDQGTLKCVTQHELGGDTKTLYRTIALAEHELNVLKRSVRETWAVAEGSTCEEAK
jgi:hypothetical protein